MIALRFVFASLLLALVAGCGDGRPSLVEATGTVTIDGKPLEGATVSFQPLETSADGFQRPVTGVTDTSGKFTLGTYGKGDGAPTGKYAVSIQKRELVGGELPENYNSEDPNAVPLKYLWITPAATLIPPRRGWRRRSPRAASSPACSRWKPAADRQRWRPPVRVSGAMCRSR